MNRKKPQLEMESLAETLRQGIESHCLDRLNQHVGIHTFIERYLDLGITPSIPQLALLKAFYQEPLTEAEQSILEFWRQEGKTNWQKDTPYQYLILEAGRRSGKCLHEHTLIPTEEGWLTLGEIHPAGTPDASAPLYLPVKSEAGTVLTSHFYTYGLTSTRWIRTEKGFYLEGRPEHRIRNAHGDWQELGDLTPGTEVKLWRKGSFGTNTSAQKQAYLLGLLCNQMFNTIPNEVRLEVPLRDGAYFKTILANYGYRPTTYPSKSRQRRHLLIADANLRQELANLGLKHWKGEETEIPISIRTGCQGIQRQFLIALFEANEGEGYRLVHPSWRLLHQTQCLLLGFGIVSRIQNYRKPKCTQTLYTLEVCPEDLGKAKAQLPLQNPLKSEQTKGIKADWEPGDEVFVDRIAEVGEGYGLCLDLHIPERECYLAAGFSSHNTNVCGAVIGAYEFFKLSRLPNPQLHYGIAKSTTISIVCLATQATQGQRTIFAGIKNLLEDSPYFQRLIKQNEILLLDEEVRYPSKRLAIYAGNSKSASQVGGTVKALIMDEVARFENDKGVANAIELWNNLGAATLTFGYEAIKVAVSSAWCEGDAIQILKEDGQFTPRTLTFSLCSWDLNPDKASRSNPVIVADYNSNPTMAALEYENIRPSVHNSFIPPAEIQQLERRPANISLKAVERNINGTLYHSIECQAELDDSVCFIHLDPSLGKDGYALAAGHCEWNEQEQRIVVIDGLALWQSTPGIPIYLADVENVIKTIYHSRPVGLVSTDHYGAGAETIQRLKTQGIRCETIFFSNRQQLQMYELLRQLIHQKRLVLPGDSPWYGTLVRELGRLQLVKGNKIDHPPGPNESKDLADAVAGVCWQLHKTFSPKLAYPSPTPNIPHTTSLKKERLRQTLINRRYYYEYRYGRTYP